MGTEGTPINEKVQYGTGCCGPYIDWQAHDDERGGPDPVSDYNGREPVWLGGSVGDDDLRRIAACWNACSGIPTAALEAGVVGELVAAAEAVLGDVCFAEDCGKYPVSEVDLLRLQAALALAKGVANGD